MKCTVCNAPLVEALQVNVDDPNSATGRRANNDGLCWVCQRLRLTAIQDVQRDMSAMQLS